MLFSLKLWRGAGVIFSNLDSSDFSFFPFWDYLVRFDWSKINKIEFLLGNSSIYGYVVYPPTVFTTPAGACFERRCRAYSMKHYVIWTHVWKGEAVNLFIEDMDSKH